MVEFVGLAVSCLAMLLYVSKLSLYKTNLDIERWLLIYLYENQINFYMISRLFNIAAAFFMYAMSIFWANYAEKSHTRRTYIKIVITFVPILIYLWLNEPETTYTIYIVLNRYTGLNNVAHYVLSNIVSVYNYAMLVVFGALPFLKIYKTYRKAVISYNKKQIFLMSLIFSMLDVFYLAFFVVGPFRDLSNFGMDYLKFSNAFKGHSGYYVYFMPVIVLFMIISISVLIFKFNVVYVNETSQAYNIKKRLRSISSEIYGLLHAYKNTLFSILVVAREGKIKTDNEGEKNRFAKIEKNAEDSMTNISRLLDVFNDTKLEREKTNVLDCVNMAITMVSRDDIKISCTVKDSVTDCDIYADEFYIDEVFANILKNSVEAIDAKGEKAGKIDIEIYEEYSWLSIRITDNGCGIDKQNLKKIFKPLQSTKNNKNNWGIGLAYAYKIVCEHSGVIYVKSEKNKFTTFEVILPLMCGKSTL